MWSIHPYMRVLVVCIVFRVFLWKKSFIQLRPIRNHENGGCESYCHTVVTVWQASSMGGCWTVGDQKQIIINLCDTVWVGVSLWNNCLFILPIEVRLRSSKTVNMANCSPPSHLDENETLRSFVILYWRVTWRYNA